MINFFKVFYELFIDMAYYLMIGVSLVGILNLFMNKEFIARQLGKDNFWLQNNFHPHNHYESLCQFP